MDSKEFIYFRKRLNKTQKQIAQLLGTSLKAIHSYEQGWRSVPPYAEQQIFFLVSRIAENSVGL
jgi:DNA-binding XRE family transcriptional regulator